MTIMLQVIDPKVSTVKHAVFREIVANLKAPLCRLRDTTNGYNALMEKKEDADVLLSQKGKESLARLNLRVTILPEQSANRSIFVRLLDSSVGKKSADELTEELARHHTFMAGCEVIKIKNDTHIMKIECASVTAANTALEDDPICIFTCISPSQIKMEEYVTLSPSKAFHQLFLMFTPTTSSTQ